MLERKPRGKERLLSWVFSGLVESDEIQRLMEEELRPQEEGENKGSKD